MCAISSSQSHSEILRAVALERRIPRATYRLQFNREFTFDDARAIADYLEELGVSDVYASPLLRSCSGSPHGYDICDYHSLNPEVGGEEGFNALSAALRRRGLGVLLDVVPNHMGIGEPGNAWWMDVLENGPASPWAGSFDIDWQPVKRELEGKVLLPVLEDQYGKVLEAGKLRLALQEGEGAFALYYYETRLPIAPDTWRPVLAAPLPELKQALGEASEQVQELESILTALTYLPPRTFLSPEKMAERGREKEVIKRRLAALLGASAQAREAIQAAVAHFNGRVGDPRSFDPLDELLSRQSYRLAFWRVASDEINYRRFFDINKLAAIRIELPAVFRSAHELIFRLLSEGKVSALRVDHPDGLWNPGKYFRWLQEAYLCHMLRARTEAPPEEAEQEACEWLLGHMMHQDTPGAAWPLYVVAEKILSEKEPLPESWAVAGTTGYDFLNLCNGLFVDRAAARELDRSYSQFIGRAINFGDLANSAKKMIMTASLASEINALSRQLERLAERNRLYRDFTLNSLRLAIREVIACLPIYRTYIVDATVDPRDAGYVEAAVDEARRRNQRIAREIFDFLRDMLLLRNLEYYREEDRARLLEFVMKFQQVTGPVMAKSLEDTAFYIYNRLVSLNEVGGDPRAFGVTPQEFHRQNRQRQARWPYSLLAGSTHDTKRGEDVRARIDVLSELPREWRAAVGRWSRLNQRRKTLVEGEAAPSRNDEYLLYQTLVGAWPEWPLEGEALANFRERIVQYMQKATKEAKTRTSWVSPNARYDEAVRQFVERLLEGKPGDRFLALLGAFARRVAFFGQFGSLAQTLLRLTAPGVPDLYQGTELWGLSLVDPDNRRPVDYARRRAMLAELRERQAATGGGGLAGLARDLLAQSGDGRIKMYVIERALKLRREREALFRDGDYAALEPAGEKSEHAVAFARRLGGAAEGDAALVIVPRLVARLTGGAETPPLGEGVWKDTRLALPRELGGRTWRNVFTGQSVAAQAGAGAPAIMIKDALADFPVALLAP